MKNKKRIISLAISAIILTSSTVFASNWQKDTFIYGAGLDDSRINEVANTLNVDMSKTENSNVNSADLKKYLHYDVNDYDMISSVLVKKLKEGQGVKVNILTPDLITDITESQYTNAAITAGVDDLEINVASPTKVTGESALVGVYKAIELNGEEVDTERSKTAQDELETVNIIVKDNKDKENFDSKKLDDVIIEVKQKLSEYKEENGETADSETVKQIINQTVNNFNLSNVLSNNNIDILVNYFEKYQNTSAIDSKEVKDNLKNLANTIKDNGNKIYEDHKSDIDNAYQKAKDSGLLDEIKNFFISIFNEIKSWFN